MGCLAASLASTHHVPVAWPSAGCDYKKFLQTLLTVSQGEKVPQLRTTKLEEGKELVAYIKQYVSMCQMFNSLNPCTNSELQVSLRSPLQEERWREVQDVA